MFENLKSRIRKWLQPPDPAERRRGFEAYASGHFLGQLRGKGRLGGSAICHKSRLKKLGE